MNPILTVNDAADVLRVHIRTLERWRQTGEGPRYVKMGRRVGYRRADLEAWLDANATTSTSAPRL
ncbi:helix-turn-helix domain-containing protein [Parvibaculum sedimenti]|uniref:Helix-turn-helix domain-containing protein n=1 Tax=Parvibaculum sedimenti TaxID=2608632 RepID=A0A6N6VFE6_9HYPH|nr:helix-turn-helix domain-containing protein [Parvibaculum sedimenti]KAB7738422.1 helix-turn-helix domain-containing protein [Parvibaculum sedimenti]